jgi:hypothetical protein
MTIKESTVSLIDSKQCDDLSKMTNSDIKELINKLRNYPFIYRKN